MSNGEPGNAIAGAIMGSQAVGMRSGRADGN